MKLIKKLDTRRAKNNHMMRFGLFLCSYCNKEIKKRIYDGMKAKSCGCMHGNLIRLAVQTHGDKMPGSKYHRLYNIWIGMKQRCSNENGKAYKNYGGRGIMVCNGWKKNYILFKIWALNNRYKDNLTIERINNNKGYEPSNCKWATYAEQNRNRRDNTLNWLTVRLVRALYEDGYTVKMLFKIFDITKSNLRHIINNRSWKEEVV